jgi:hypothetical protein
MMDSVTISYAVGILRGAPFGVNLVRSNGFDDQT